MAISCPHQGRCCSSYHIAVSYILPNCINRMPDNMLGMLVILIIATYPFASNLLHDRLSTLPPLSRPLYNVSCNVKLKDLVVTATKFVVTCKYHLYIYYIYIYLFMYDTSLCI